MVKKWGVTIPDLTGKTKRLAYIYLPKNYIRYPRRRYPVLYMFDGHNVFFDTDATYGKSWGMKEYLDKTGKDLIVVAVECNHVGCGRLEEYSPFSYENDTLGRINGKGKLYMDWLVKTLKPYIDKNYRTIPDRENTLIAGSSMGGLMSLYAAVCYNHVFRRAACLSSSVWVDPDQVLQMIAGANVQNDTCIYMDYGSMEMHNHEANASALMSVVQMLLTKRVDLTFRIVPGGTHCEACWEKQIPVFMDCLGL